MAELDSMFLIRSDRCVRDEEAVTKLSYKLSDRCVRDEEARKLREVVCLLVVEAAEGVHV